MSFNAEEFLKEVTWEKFDELKKPAILALANYYEMGFKQSTRKQVIKNALIGVGLGMTFWKKHVWKKKRRCKHNLMGT